MYGSHRRGGGGIYVYGSSINGQEESTRFLRLGMDRSKGLLTNWIFDIKNNAMFFLSSLYVVFRREFFSL